MVKTQIYRSCEAVKVRGKVAGKLGERIGWIFIDGVGWKCIRNSISFCNQLHHWMMLTVELVLGKKCLDNSHPKPQHFIIIHRRKTNYFLQIKVFSLPLTSLANFRTKKSSFVRNSCLYDESRSFRIHWAWEMYFSKRNITLEKGWEKENGWPRVSDHLLEVFNSKLYMKFYHLYVKILFYFSM